jgi:hypothetical protein
MPLADLPSCAAKYKSVKALRGERELFEQLHCTQIYFTANMSTNLVLKLGTTPITVQSDRPALHHELSESQLVLYVPSSQRQRESCYRSQVPVLLAHLLGVSPTAKHDIHLILNQPPEDLDILLSELDIPHVDWIERPVAEVYDLPEDEIPVTPPARPAENLSAFSVSGSTIRETSALRTDAGNSRQSSRTWVNDDIQIPPNTPTRHYERLIEQVVQSAQRASHRQDLSGANTVPLRNAPPIHDALGYTFDHTATFGDRDANPMAHDTRIGAAGEAYVRTPSTPKYSTLTNHMPFRSSSSSPPSTSPTSAAKIGAAQSAACSDATRATQTWATGRAARLPISSTRTKMAV